MKKLFTFLAISIACLCVNAQTATVVLIAGDVWGDSTGYQMLLDPTATLFGSVIPATSGAISADCSENLDDIYAQFPYKIPQNADGNCTTSNIVLKASCSVEIPAGTYDFCITNPTPNDKIYIASEYGNIGGRADDYLFEAGKVYTFTITFSDSHDVTNVTITTLQDPEVPGTGISDIAANNVSIFPNPANEVLHVKATGFQTIEIVNFLGQVVYNTNITNSEMQINIANFNAGVYFVRLNGEGRMVTQKVVVY